MLQGFLNESAVLEITIGQDMRPFDILLHESISALDTSVLTEGIDITKVKDKILHIISVLTNFIKNLMNKVRMKLSDWRNASKKAKSNQANLNLHQLPPGTTVTLGEIHDKIDIHITDGIGSAFYEVYREKLPLDEARKHIEKPMLNSSGDSLIDIAIDEIKTKRKTLEVNPKTREIIMDRLELATDVLYGMDDIIGLHLDDFKRTALKHADDELIPSYATIAANALMRVTTKFVQYWTLVHSDAQRALAEYNRYLTGSKDKGDGK